MPHNASLFEYKLAVYSAPTLMKYKCGSLFNISKSDIHNYQECFDYYNHHLSYYDLQINILRESKESVLVYIYSPKQLKRVLENKAIVRFLKSQGYHTQSISHLLVSLKKRFNTNVFPHEIGIFLNYPLEDVLGFIENKPVKHIGYWKVYGNEHYALNCFKEYDRCHSIMKEYMNQGYHLEEILAMN